MLNLPNLYKQEVIMMDYSPGLISERIQDGFKRRSWHERCHFTWQPIHSILFWEITPSMQTIILQTNTGKKGHKDKALNYVIVWLDILGMAIIFSFAKWKIHIASLMIPHWKQPSMCRLKWYHQISQEYRGSILLQTKIQVWYHNGTNGGWEQEFL